MCEIFSPFTPIICRILFGVASATNQISEKKQIKDSNKDARARALSLSHDFCFQSREREMNQKA